MTMIRIVTMVPKNLSEWLDDETERCGCGSRASHLRHILKALRDAQEADRLTTS
jgi:hypothetical protein